MVVSKFDCDKIESIRNYGFDSGILICDIPYSSVYEATITSIGDFVLYSNSYISSTDSCVDSVQNSKNLLEQINSYCLKFVFTYLSNTESSKITLGLINL